MKPLVAIVGPTASGKTELAIAIAKKFNGEIICADSRTVYRGMDIGTAKPTKVEQQAAKHHLIDVVNASEQFTVADFKQRAAAAIEDITTRGKLPILVGGSGLYVDALLYDYTFARDAGRDKINARHASPKSAGTKSTLRENTLLVGLTVPREVLRDRITARVETMIHLGLVDEVRRLNEQFRGAKALDAPGYKAMSQFINNKVSLSDAKALFATADHRLAKRQMTWFKRNNEIRWTSNRDDAVDIVTTFLNKKA